MKTDSFVQDAVVEDNIGGITKHEQTDKVGSHFAVGTRGGPPAKQHGSGKQQQVFSIVPVHNPFEIHGDLI